MEKLSLFEIKALYRDDFRVTGYSFGYGEKTAAIVGSLRGNEYQQIYVCSLLIKKLRQLEKEGRIKEGKSILIIPCGNPYSVNVKKRFWTIDNTDVNRMFPGYNLGETTQRIADGIFNAVKDYKIGVQLASFYMPGNFVPQIRIMKTGLENVDMARQFGLPYVVLHHPRPFDTATLNYNWQIWETEAFSLYTSSTGEVDKNSASMGERAILNFLSKQGIIDYSSDEGYISRVVETTDFIDVRTSCSGFFEGMVKAHDRVEKGQVLAQIVHPYEAVVKEELVAPIEGTVGFIHNETLAYQNTAVIKLIP